MDGLPAELCIKIFHLLDHQSLASAPQGAHVYLLFCHLLSRNSYHCSIKTKWNTLTSDDELWRRLFKDRWGADAAAFYAPEGSKTWKDVFIVQDRCDRYGLGVRIIREGSDYYLIYQGEIQRYLGSRQHVSCDSKDSPEQSIEEQRQISDRILFFLGDLEAACADAKRVKV
uniref:F-box protein n=1 Tax=Oryza punctata TaxID=4537 RepID=A0A0E0K3R2_ORYPU